MTALEFILIAAFGSAIQELIHLYDIRTTLNLPDTSSILKSWQYWLVTGSMIIASGIGTWLLYGDSISVKSAILILGAAFPLLFKKLVATAGVDQQAHAPKVGPTLGSFSFQDYFQ